MYPYARAEDLDGVNTARVYVPPTPEFRIILVQFLRRHPSLPPDLVFEGKDSLAVAGSISRALNRRLKWPVAFLPPKTPQYFYQWPIGAHGPSPQAVYMVYWDMLAWLTDTNTVRVMLITFGAAGTAVLFSAIMSWLLYELDVHFLGK